VDEPLVVPVGKKNPLPDYCRRGFTPGGCLPWPLKKDCHPRVPQRKAWTRIEGGPAFIPWNSAPTVRGAINGLHAC